MRTGDKMGKRSVSVIVLVGIICLAIGVVGTYLFQQQEITDLKTSHITEKDNLNEQILALNNDLESDIEFNRLYFKAIEEYSKGMFTEGFARAYYVEADDCREYNSFDWGEIYYKNSRDYFNYSKYSYEKAILYLIEAKDYITNDATMEYIDKYIDLLNITKERCVIDYTMSDDLRLACYYYNLSNWDAGNEKLEDSNEYIDELESLIKTYNTLLTEIEILLESTWKD